MKIEFTETEQLEKEYCREWVIADDFILREARGARG